MSVILDGLDMPEENPRTINIYRDGSWVDAYTTENGKCSETKECYNVLEYRSLFECSNCGWSSSDTYYADPMKYCPGCGERITER